MNSCKYFSINKVVVASGHGDAPKYVGEGVALCGLLGKSGRSSGPKNMQFHVVFHIFL